MRLLVTGAGGMLGQAVSTVAVRLGHDVIGLRHGELDITDQAAVEALVAEAQPAALVNCAAWTDVDGAEEHEELALAVNGAGAGHLAHAADAAGARIVHVSTDYVFDGRKTIPYVEDDPPSPLGAYGRTKLAGEQAVTAGARDHAIVRTAWLFGAGGRNFVDTMLALGAEREEVRVVTDQVGCPTWAGHLAPALVELAERRDTGVFHVAAAGRCSWYELALEAFDVAGVPCRVIPATTDSFPRPAPRPAFSVLESIRPEGPILPPWREGLRAHLAARVEVAP
jgi:dTDP-4-dehydrorhamnose reductase